MGKNKSPATSPRRPWRFLRLAILWAQKGGSFKQRHFFDIRLLPTYLRNLRRSDAADSLHCRERELSFDDTPSFHFKLHRPASFRLPRIPCITPSVNFDDDDEIALEKYRKTKLLEARSCQNLDKRSDNESEFEDDEMEEEEEEQEIDLRAERFIMEFYDQMKLQRQISYLEYHEMLHRGTS